MSKEKEKSGCLKLILKIIIYPFSFSSMIIVAMALIGLIALWPFPGIATENEIALSDLMLRLIDKHRLEPFYLFNEDGSFTKSLVEIEFPGKKVETVKTGPHQYLHTTVEEKPGKMPTVISTTPHTNIPVPSLNGAREKVELLFDEVPKAWAQTIFVVWWAKYRDENLAEGADIKPEQGTEDEHLWFLWHRLKSDQPNADSDLFQLEKLVRRAYPDENDYQSAMAWASGLYQRLASIPKRTHSIEVIDSHEPAKEFILDTMPPDNDWSRWWLLYQYLGLTPTSRDHARQRWLNYFCVEESANVLEWGRDLEQQRRKDGEPMPPASDNLALVCVIERLTGTDPYGIRTRETIYRQFDEDSSRIFLVQAAVMYGVYPNDELYYFAAGNDRLKLFPYGEKVDLSTRVVIRIIMLLWLLWGLRCWIFGVLANYIYKLRDDPMLLEYREKRRLFHSGLGWTFILSYGLIPIITWLIAKLTLPIELQILVTPGQLLLETYLAVWLGGTVFLCLTQLIAVTLIKFRIDPETSWLDEIIGMPLGMLILWRFGSDWVSIVSFVALSLVPEIVIRLSSNPRPSPPPGRSQTVQADEWDYSADEGLSVPAHEEPSTWKKVLKWVGIVFLILVIIGMLAEPDKKKKRGGGTGQQPPQHHRE